MAEVVRRDEQRAHVCNSDTSARLRPHACHDCAVLPGGPSPTDRAFFGHPRGLSTLFFTEMWERFSYYGMRGFLILYMTAARAVGGLGLDTATAGAIYGTYTSMVYLMSLPGGWIADRLIGQRRAVLYRRHPDRCGHYSLAIPAARDVLSRPGADRARHGPPQAEHQRHRRPAVRAGDDRAATPASRIFYMGINLGAFIGPLITGYLAQDDGFRAWLGGLA